MNANLLLHELASRSHKRAADRHDWAAKHFRCGDNAKGAVSTLEAISSATDALMESLKAAAASPPEIKEALPKVVASKLVPGVVIFEIYESRGVWSVLRNGRFFGDFHQRIHAEGVVDNAIQNTVDEGGRAERLPTVQSN